VFECFVHDEPRVLFFGQAVRYRPDARRQAFDRVVAIGRRHKDESEFQIRGLER
jgi:hypothetical protein